MGRAVVRRAIVLALTWPFVLGLFALHALGSAGLYLIDGALHALDALTGED